MRLTESKILQLKTVEVATFKIEENIKGVKKFNLNGDFDLIVSSQNDKAYKGLKFKLNLNNKSQNAAIKAKVEIIALFDVDRSLSEKEQDKYILYNGLSIIYGIVRGMIFQACSVVPPEFRLLPSVNIKEFVIEKIKENPISTDNS